jgi:uncharacterized membrane protein
LIKEKSKIKYLIETAAVFLLLFSGAVTFAAPKDAYENSEKIISYGTVIRINKDSTVNVLERIIYDFGAENKHGIFRTIPFKYKTPAGNQEIDITDIAVKDEKNQDYQFTSSAEGSNLVIKIGNPVSTITGVHVYDITYKVSRAIGYFKDFDEIYWNAVGDKWDIPILKSQAVVYLPQAASTTAMQASCYIGSVGSNETCPIEENTVGENLQDMDYAIYIPHRTLSPHEGFTVALGFPKNMVSEPSSKQRIFAFLKDNSILVLPVIVFIAMFAIWFRRGRDPKGAGVIIPQYDSPDDLKPMEVSGIMSQRIENSAISAEIIYLATKGYLKITRTQEKLVFIKKTEYTFKKLKDWSGIPDSFESILLAKIFESSNEVTLTELQDNFYKALGNIKDSAINSLVKKGYYKTDPVKTIAMYGGIGALVGTLIAILSLKYFGTAGITSGVLSAVIIILFGLVMPKKTPKGMSAYEYILGLKEYLQIAEKDRINFHNAPEKSPELFEKMLPYAMVLGVEKAWAKEFKDIYMTPPSWYSDNTGMAFNTIVFANSLNQFNSYAIGAFTSAPGSSSGSGGGGFSGDGAGGGGGGSW